MTSTPTAPSAIDTQPEGVWLVQFDPDHESILGPHQALVTFHDDGTIDADFSAKSSDGSDVPVLSSGRGELVLQEAVCRISLIALMNNASQRFAGTATFEVEVELDEDTRTFDGTFDVAIASAGGQSTGAGSGTLHGESVSLDP